ncbi:MAG: NADH-quinone oxidoreductase subunit N [Chloroflexi bacterium ADurb.Bin325]|nr:MAG: NADH-quinone oxidoreductase subunit N [Chloroflexi bacterium ADurb.Bin325]
MTLPTLNFLAILPLLILVAATLLVLLADLVVRNKRVLTFLGLLAVAASLAAVLLVRPAAPTFQGMTLADELGLFASVAILVATGLALLLALERTSDFTRRPGAYVALLLLATAGMIVMAKASDFITIFLGLEILSLSLYILVGFAQRDARSNEAALKYFLLGAFASGFFLYGMALIYAATGSTNLAEISKGIASHSASLPFAPLLPIGVGLLLVGYGFKLALVPFHMWTPDVYQGAPTSVTAFMSVATKTAAFASLIRVLAAVWSGDRPWLLALAGLAVVTMTLGNLAALRQTSLKRMLAYSSIAHAGYVLTGLAAGNDRGFEGALYYLIAYTFMNLGAFATIQAVQRRDQNDVTTEQITGLSTQRPGLALLMTVFMFALTGMPPLVGFFGKLYVFSGAVQGGMTWLAIVGVINSAIAAYYYLRVTVLMYMGGATAAAGDIPRTGWAVWTTLVITAVATLALGLWQQPWMESIREAVTLLALR